MTASSSSDPVRREVEAVFRAVVTEHPRLDDEDCVRDILGRLSGGAWQPVRSSGRGARSIAQARVERQYDDNGVHITTSLTGPWLLEQVRVLRKRLCCTRCGQLTD